MNGSKPEEMNDPLSFFSPRLREMLRRLARRDRRTDLEELAFLIEARARGQHRDHGDEMINPPISLESLPAPLVTQVSVSRIEPKA